MTEGWGMVAAAAIGFAGLFVGLIVGRRAVRDQDQVEHEQRQEAYVAFLDAWDAAFKAFDQQVDLDEDQQLVRDHAPDYESEDEHEAVVRTVDATVAPYAGRSSGCSSSARKASTVRARPWTRH